MTVPIEVMVSLLNILDAQSRRHAMCAGRTRCTSTQSLDFDLDLNHQMTGRISLDLIGDSGALSLFRIMTTSR